MITFKGTLKDIVITLKNKAIITLETENKETIESELTPLLGVNNGLKISLGKWRETRSLNANAYAWVLMDKIANKLKTTKEEIYREIVSRVGVFEVLPIKKVALESFYRRWQAKGLGWVCENLGDCKNLKGYETIVAYYGTSTYNTEEMSRFINEIIEEAKKLGIDTITPNEQNKLISLWKTVDTK